MSNRALLKKLNKLTVNQSTKLCSLDVMVCDGPPQLPTDKPRMHGCLIIRRDLLTYEPKLASPGCPERYMSLLGLVPKRI